MPEACFNSFLFSVKLKQVIFYLLQRDRITGFNSLLLFGLSDVRYKKL